jgi:hypothetical protein
MTITLRDIDQTDNKILFIAHASAHEAGGFHYESVFNNMAQ